MQKTVIILLGAEDLPSDWPVEPLETISDYHMPLSAGQIATADLIGFREGERVAVLKSKHGHTGIVPVGQFMDQAAELVAGMVSATEPEEKEGPWSGPRLTKREIMAMSENTVKATLWHMGYRGADELSDEAATDKLLTYYGYEFEDDQP